MKRIVNLAGRVALLVLVSALSVPAPAQKHVEKIFASVLKDKRLEVNRDVREERDARTGELELRRNFYSFTLPARSRIGIKDILGAFYEDESRAYWSYSKSAGSYRTPSHNLVYGRQGETVCIGNDQNYNYVALNFKDKKHPDSRHSYVVKWREADEGTKVTLMALYGLIPQSQSSEKGVEDAFQRHYNSSVVGSDGSNSLRVQTMRIFKQLCDLYSGKDSEYDGGVAREIRTLVVKRGQILTDTDRMMCRMKLETLINKSQSSSGASLLRSAVSSLRD